MDQQLQWFEAFSQAEASHYLQKHPIAYFCAEFALTDDLHTYAGGLGILAGDYLREAADRKVPVVAIGLYYPEGYVAKDVGPSGVRIRQSEHIPPEQTFLTLVTDEHGTPINIELPLFDTKVVLRAWKWEKESVTAYFLDTHLPENEQHTRDILHRLYDADKETRLKQEVILGIGGFRFLEKLGITPALYHMNEGHSAFLSLEVIRQTMQSKNLPFTQAVDEARKKIVFTNHTLVAAGHDTFSKEVVATLLNPFAQQLQTPTTELLALGVIPDSNLFSMTALALTMSHKVNAVSVLHGQRAQEIWPKYPMEVVTNGIHLPTWDESSGGVSHELHREHKKNLLAKVKEITGKEWKEDTLLLGWARRIVGYKRPLALIDDVLRFKSIATQQGKEVKVIFAGIGHYEDPEGEHILQLLYERLSGELSECAVYLPDYTMQLAKLLVAGCDVWLNTPIVGYEACGTSGMKAALNGTLQCSTNDGWIKEVDMSQMGWLIESEKLNEHLLEVVEKQIVPSFYQHQNEVDHWLTRMQSGREIIKAQFSATRMLREYIEKLYTPLLQQELPVSQNNT